MVLLFLILIFWRENDVPKLAPKSERMYVYIAHVSYKTPKVHSFNTQQLIQGAIVLTSNCQITDGHWIVMTAKWLDVFHTHCERCLGNGLENNAYKSTSNMNPLDTRKESCGK